MRPVRWVVLAFAMALAMRALLWGTAGPFAAARAGTASFDELVALAAAAAAFAVLGWVGVVLVVTTLAVLPGAVGRCAHRFAGRIAPGLSGRLARVALGFALTAGPLSACTPALGSGEAQHEVVAAGVVGDTGLPGVGRIGEVIRPSAGVTLDEGLTHEPSTNESTLGPTVGQPTATPVPPPAAGLTEMPTREQHPDSDVVVMRGDTLWAIAARHLGADATAADITAEWPRWYAANRATIGDDPDLILPGTILRPPG